MKHLKVWWIRETVLEICEEGHEEERRTTYNRAWSECKLRSLWEFYKRLEFNAVL